MKANQPAICTAHPSGELAALLGRTYWTSAGTGATTITYSFVSTGLAEGAAPEFGSTAQAFGDGDRQLTRDVLARIEAVCNVRFLEVPDDAGQPGTLRYGYSAQVHALGFAGYGFYPGEAPAAGDVWLAPAMASPRWDAYRPELLLHETLHALGLTHPFGPGRQHLGDRDVVANTVMSYTNIPGAPLSCLESYPAEPMVLDIAALQHFYGANAATGAGATTYDLGAPAFRGVFRAIWDASGSDTLDASGVAAPVRLDLEPGARSDVGTSVRGRVHGPDGSVTVVAQTDTLAIAEGTLIENAVGGAGNDRLAGNGLANRLAGGTGDDRLAGRGGDDLLEGGPGLDTAVYAGVRSGYAVTAGGSRVADRCGEEGTDVLQGIERLAFADVQLAFDLDGHAGTAARIAGAVFGPGAVRDAALIGQVLGLLDGGAAPLEVAGAALAHRLGPAPAAEEAVALLWTNVVGTPGTPADLAPYLDMLAQGRSPRRGWPSRPPKCR